MIEGISKLRYFCAFKVNTYHRWIYDSIDGPIREVCQKFVHSFVNNECHEKNDTIDYGENDRRCKSWLIVVDLKVSTCPREIIMKKGLVWHIYSYLLQSTWCCYCLNTHSTEVGSAPLIHFQNFLKKSVSYIEIG